VALFGIDLGSYIKNGTYRFTFGYPFDFLVPDSMNSLPIEKGVGFGKKIVINNYNKDAAANEIYFDLTVEDDPLSQATPVTQGGNGGVAKATAAAEDAGVPIVTIALAIIAVVGVSIIFLKSVQQIIESPQGTILVVAVAIVALGALIFTLRGKRARTA